LLVQRSFYLGISFFLNEAYTPTDNEKAEQKIANGLYELGTSDGAAAQLIGTDFTYASTSFDWDWATADDQPGLPQLLYIDVQFEIPTNESGSVIESIERDDGGTIVFVSIGHMRILEMGGLEILED
jgi:hypothetical protein